MTLAAQTRLGPYEILEPLGAGGMGEVYRARDPRLSRDVAVKLITTDGTPSPDRLRRFETEARAAAQLSHPNVVTVFDVGSHEGQPYLVLELLEGETLSQTLRTGLPPLRQAVTWALDISRGLAAAHERGIVHRDLKPDNVFLTSDGRVKILDFGLAKLHEPLVSEEADRESPTATKDTSPGVLLGTVGYMSPEQVKGETPDPRTDVFALGTVLFEMVTGRKAFGGSTAPEILASILRDEPPTLESIQPGLPATLETVVRRCLAKRPADRFSSGLALEAALETLLASLEPSRVSLARPSESRGPYPGLSSFTEADSERFFGRETEAEALWGRLESRRLLAVVGPSGAGKTSFVRAGVVASRPAAWGTLVCSPGSDPLRGLGRALAPELASDPEALRGLLGFDDPETAFELLRRWRGRHAEALLVVDQFEELFTLNGAEMQATFAALLGRLAGEGDVHVLLSLRDDFLMSCGAHEALARVFTELTPLMPLGRESLWRALTEPAKREGFAFEDDSLVEEMLESVEGARGALPLLAFAVARLWEKRDRERKLLTRKAYEEIGGVAGALALHAEQTLERIGVSREPLVRELFRNLVTAQWTRAVADREQLLSVVPDRDVGAQVLDQLIDARLLTSYEVRESDAPLSRSERASDEDRAKNLAEVPSGDVSAQTATTHRVEIVHESLLRAWPRLVRWQAQDEEGAVLRDQLRQAANLWKEKGRPDDLLWTGTSEREFELWRDRYPGKLTALEDDFAQAMVRRARRRKRLRRIATAAVVVGLSVVAGAIAVSRQEAIEQARRAEAEARRAEAGKLLALGQTHLENDPTAALAYARASLELADTLEARTFALEVLWRGPTARILPVRRLAEQAGLPEDPGAIRIALSPDGRWLATVSSQRVLVFPRDGGPPRALPLSPVGSVDALAFGPRSDVLATGGAGASLRLWSVPEMREIGKVELGGVYSEAHSRGEGLWTSTNMGEGAPLLIRSWSLPDLAPTVLGTFSPPSLWHLHPRDATVAYSRGRSVYVRPLDVAAPSRARVLGTAGDEVRDVVFSPRGDRVASLDRSGEIRVWSTTGDTRTPLSVFQGPRYEGFVHYFDPGGHFVTQSGPNFALYLWDTEAPPGADPLALGRPVGGYSNQVVFGPAGRWVATSYGKDTVEFWPLRRQRAQVLRGFASTIWTMAFTHDSRGLATCSMLEPARFWPLSAAGGTPRDLVPEEPCASVTTDPGGDRVLLGAWSGKVLLVPTSGGPVRQLSEGWKSGFTLPLAFDPTGRRAVAFPQNMRGPSDPEQRVFRVWDLVSGDERLHSIAHVVGADWMGFGSVAFAPDGSLYVAGHGPARRLVLPDEPGGTVSSETIIEAGSTASVLSQDGRLLLVLATEMEGFAQEFGDLLVFDLVDDTSRCITSHGRLVSRAAFDPSGRVVVTAGPDGVVRAGPVTGEEPHLLLGHAGPVSGLAVSPDGQWIASATEESIRIWPMPDVTKPPFHTLPHEELMAKLDALTNLRLVRNPDEPTGWALETGPFPGWEEVPEW